MEPLRARSEIGFMTVAVRSADYVEMAVDLVLSLREWHDDPVAVAVDAPLEAYIAENYPTIFDAVIRIPDEVPIGWACKLAIAEISPFRRTVFIDADTIVLRDLEPVLQDAERTSFAMMGRWDTPLDVEVDDGLTVGSLQRQFRLDRYFRCSSRAFVFERAYGRKFLAECMDVLVKDFPAGGAFSGPGDEVALGVVAARRGMAQMSEPFPVYWNEEFPALRSDNRWKPLCHLHDPLPVRTMKWLMAEAVERRRTAGLPSISIDHWLRKVTRRSLAARAEALLRNWAINRYIDRHRSPVVARELPPSAVSATDGPLLDAAPPHDIPEDANLLFHRAYRKRRISTPHFPLAIEDDRDHFAARQLALTFHCWPEAPSGMRLEVASRHGNHGTSLQVRLAGPLPDHPEAVACLRFTSRFPDDGGGRIAIKARADVRLISPGTLRNSVLAIGMGETYLGSMVFQDLRRMTGELTFPGPQDVAGRYGPFLEFRLSIAQLPVAETGICLELSEFHLGGLED